MRLSNDDLRQIESTRIVIPDDGGSEANELADAFNTELDSAFDEIDSMFSTTIESIDAGTITLAELDAIRQQQIDKKLTVFQLILSLLQIRLDVGKAIQAAIVAHVGGLKSVSDSAFVDAQSKLRKLGLTGAELDRSARSVPEVATAMQEYTHSKASVAALESADLNAPTASIFRLQRSFADRFTRWIGELSGIDSRPVPEAVDSPNLGQWRTTQLAPRKSYAVADAG